MCSPNQLTGFYVMTTSAFNEILKRSRVYKVIFSVLDKKQQSCSNYLKLSWYPINSFVTEVPIT